MGRSAAIHNFKSCSYPLEFVCAVVFSILFPIHDVHVFENIICGINWIVEVGWNFQMRTITLNLLSVDGATWVYYFFHFPLSGFVVCCSKCSNEECKCTLGSWFRRKWIFPKNQPLSIIIFLNWQFLLWTKMFSKRCDYKIMLYIKNN